MYKPLEYLVYSLFALVGFWITVAAVFAWSGEITTSLIISVVLFCMVGYFAYKNKALN